MLDEEDNIEEDGEDAESKLGRVSKDQCPLVCEQPEGTETGVSMAAPEAAGACGATWWVCVWGGPHLPRKPQTFQLQMPLGDLGAGVAWMPKLQG